MWFSSFPGSSELFFGCGGAAGRRAGLRPAVGALGVREAVVGGAGLRGDGGAADDREARGVPGAFSASLWLVWRLVVWDLAVGQNQWYHFGVAPPILVYFCGDGDTGF